MSFNLRNPENSEKGALRHIWKSVFGGTDEDIFFNNYYTPGNCIVAESGGIIAGAGHLLPFGNLVSGNLVSGDRGIPGALRDATNTLRNTPNASHSTPNASRSIHCAMIYAVATLPEYRSRGLGGAVVRELIAKGQEKGYPAIVLCPSEDSLFGYYSARSGLKDWFYVNESVFDAPMTGSSSIELTAQEPEAYARLRGGLLSGIPHINMDVRALSYQNCLCRHYGGGMYMAASPEGVSCLTVELQPGGEVLVKELLTPVNSDSGGIISGILSAVASSFPAGKYIVRTPAVNGCSPLSGFEARRFGMLASPEDLISGNYAINPPPWYGFAFD